MPLLSAAKQLKLMTKLEAIKHAWFPSNKSPGVLFPNQQDCTFPWWINSFSSFILFVLKLQFLAFLWRKNVFGHGYHHHPIHVIGYEYDFDWEDHSFQSGCYTLGMERMTKKQKPLQQYINNTKF